MLYSEIPKPQTSQADDARLGVSLMMKTWHVDPSGHFYAPPQLARLSPASIPHFEVAIGINDVPRGSPKAAPKVRDVPAQSFQAPPDKGESYQVQDRVPQSFLNRQAETDRNPKKNKCCRYLGVTLGVH